MPAIGRDYPYCEQHKPLAHVAPPLFDPHCSIDPVAAGPRAELAIAATESVSYDDSTIADSDLAVG